MHYKFQYLDTKVSTDGARLAVARVRLPQHNATFATGSLIQLQEYIKTVCLKIAKAIRKKYSKNGKRTWN
jgi:hypothetical protein